MKRRYASSWGRGGDYDNDCQAEPARGDMDKPIYKDKSKGAAGDGYTVEGRRPLDNLPGDIRTTEEADRLDSYRDQPFPYSDY